MGLKSILYIVHTLLDEFRQVGDTFLLEAHALPLFHGLSPEYLLVEGD